MNTRTITETLHKSRYVPVREVLSLARRSQDLSRNHQKLRHTEPVHALVRASRIMVLSIIRSDSP